MVLDHGHMSLKIQTGKKKKKKERVQKKMQKKKKKKAIVSLKFWM